jgi:hypothetical protein
MAKSKRQLLRPEDASSWEEFQARSVIEQAECRGSTGTNRNIGLTLLAVIPGFGAILFWGSFALTFNSASAPDGTTGTALARWPLFVLAVICTGLFVWVFGKVMRQGVRGSRRYMELDRLRKEWRARAERGEIPQTAPGGPKVWRDEMEAEAQGT